MIRLPPSPGILRRLGWLGVSHERLTLGTQGELVLAAYFSTMIPTFAKPPPPPCGYSGRGAWKAPAADGCPVGRMSEERGVPGRAARRCGSGQIARRDGAEPWRLGRVSGPSRPSARRT